MRSNIRIQLLVVNTIVLLGVFGGMSAYLVAKNTTTLRAQLKNEVRAFSVLATPPIGDLYGLYGQSGTSKIKDSMRSYLQENSSVTNATVVDLSGQPLFSYNPAAKMSVSSSQASSFTPIFEEADNGELSHVVTPYFGAGGTHTYSVVYSVSNHKIDQAIRSETISLLTFSILSLVLTSAATYTAISYIILRPIRRVSKQADIISGGNLEQQIEVAGNNEIARLGKAVNAMAESLKASIAKLQQIDKVKSEFMAITSHNLRTPLTIINSYIESVDILNSPEQLKQAISKIGASVKRLDGFAEDVLTISQFELGEQNTSADTVVVTDLLSQIADEAKATAELHSLVFDSKIKTTASVKASKPHLKGAIYNIIDNAIKFTPEGGKITLEVSQADNTVNIAVTDSGIGIAEEEIPQLFTKFHRGTSVLKYDYEGTGIGLYASKIIIDNLGGSITVMSKLGKGSTFTISLPVADAVESVHTTS